METVQPLTISPTIADLIMRSIGGECTWDSVFREFAMNGIDAGATQVYWGRLGAGMNPCSPNDPAKLYVLDDGTGFDPASMELLIGGLGESGRAQGAHLNFGIGAKVSGLPLSPCGIEYFTKQIGDRSFYRAKLAFIDGLAVLVRDTNGDAITQLGCGDVPGPIREALSGTMVIFHGAHQDHDTTKAPDGYLGGRSWVVRSLNRRFYEVPGDVVIRAEEPRNIKRPEAGCDQIAVVGSRAALTRFEPLPKSGTVEGVAKDHPGGPVKFSIEWVLAPEVDARKGDSNGRDEVGSQLAFRHGSECYGGLHGERGRAALAHFGIRYAANRVSLYVTFDEAWAPTPSRATLQRGPHAPDLESIGKAFAKLAPAAIADAERGTALRRARAGASHLFAGRLQKLSERFAAGTITWRLDPKGTNSKDCSEPGTRDRPGSGGGGTHGNSADRPAAKPQPDRFGSKGGTDPARPVRPQAVFKPPVVTYDSAGAFDSPDTMVEYFPASGDVLINSDHPALLGEQERWCALAIGGPEAQEIARSRVRSVWQAAISQQVVVARGLEAAGMAKMVDTLSRGALASTLFIDIGIREQLIDLFKAEKILNKAAA